MTRRLLVTLAGTAAMLLSACGSVVAPTMNPLAVVRAAGAKTAALKTYRMDLKMTMSGMISLATTRCGPGNQLPPALAAAGGVQAQQISPAMRAQMCASLAAQADKPPEPYSTTMSATGSFRAPSDYTYSTTMTVAPVTPSTAPTTSSMKMVHVGTATYVTDPRTGAWTTYDKLGSMIDSSAFNNLNSGSYTSILDSAKSVQDRGDTKLNGTSVHHYLVNVDPDKLVAEGLNNPALKDPAMQKLVSTYAESFRNNPTTVEVWIGIDDQLLRREVVNVTPGAPGAAAGPITDLKQHMEINLHDFNGKVDIVAPKV